MDMVEVELDPRNTVIKRADIIAGTTPQGRKVVVISSRDQNLWKGLSWGFAIIPTAALTALVALAVPFLMQDTLRAESFSLGCLKGTIALLCCSVVVDLAQLVSTCYTNAMWHLSSGEKATVVYTDELATKV